MRGSKRLNINPKKRRGNHSKKGHTSAIKVNKETLSKMTKGNFFYQGQALGCQIQESI
jgi:hypothetical protein